MDNETLIAENVEVDIETLANANSFSVQPFIRERARISILKAVIYALSPKDRKRLEAYERGE